MLNETANLRIKLSKGTKTANNKESARVLTEFETSQIDLKDKEQLNSLFTSRNYSFNYWSDKNTCSKENYKGMSGIILDIDEGMSIDDAKKTFAEYKYIIHTSTSHQVEKDKKPACDRFRIILPFNPDVGLRYEDAFQADNVYDTVKAKYSFADPAVFHRGAKFFPFFGNDDKFQLFVNTEGKWFDIEVTNSIKPATKTKIKDKHDKFITYDMEIVSKDKSRRYTLDTIKPEIENGKMECYCPFCDDLNSKNASATIQLTNDGFIQLYCSHCESKGPNGVYRQDPIEPGMFMLETKLVKVQKINNDVYVCGLRREYIRSKDQEYALTYLSRKRNIPIPAFRVEKHTSAEFKEVEYDLNLSAALLKVKIPCSIPVQMEDNDYINEWLTGLFGEHAEFIKDWMALYINPHA